MPKKTDFYRLSRPVQDRFAAATRRAAPPAPLLFQPAPRTVVWGYLAAGGVFTAAALLLFRAGWGDVASSLALHGPVALALDVALLAAAAYCVLHAVGMLRSMETMPWRPGIYLFPACVVDARDAVLVVWPVADSDGVDRLANPAPGLALRMRDGSRVVVGAPTAADAERAEAALTSRRGELAQAMAEENPHMLAELDPLHDSALSSPIGPSEAMKRSTPAWVKFDWALALVAGVALGLGVGEARNSMSDDAIYRLVSAGGTVPQLKQYLAHRGKHSQDVTDVLLPRAELREAEAQGTVDAVRDFARAHPSSKIAPEIDAAMRKAMLAELERAKAVGTVGALDDFARKNPEKLVDRELKAARHALYAKALAAWSDKAQVDSATRSFMDRLLAWAEKNGPACEVHFRMKPSKSMDDADKSAMRSGHYPGADALPSHYVNADALRLREDRIAKALADALAEAFPAEVLSVQAAPGLAADASPPPNVPVIVVDYSPEWTRTNTTSVKQNTVFAGLEFDFATSFTLPDGSPPLKVATKVWRGAELWKIKGEGMSREDFEKAVYDAMIDGAFDTLLKKLKDAFF